jgi:hypothetical protein
MKGFNETKFKVLSEESIVPEKNIISPAPNQFSHQIVRLCPYYFNKYEQTRPPDGKLKKGAKVTLLVYEKGDYCRVADKRGLYIEVLYKDIAKL